MSLFKELVVSADQIAKKRLGAKPRPLAHLGRATCRIVAEAKIPVLMSRWPVSQPIAAAKENRYGKDFPIRCRPRRGTT